MNVTLNGKPCRVEEGITLSALAPRVQGFAVALNGTVVPASSWTHTRLAENDAVEIVTAHQGG